MVTAMIIDYASDVVRMESIKFDSAKQILDLLARVEVLSIEKNDSGIFEISIRSH